MASPGGAGWRAAPASWQPPASGEDDFIPHILPFGLSLCGRREPRGLGGREPFKEDSGGKKKKAQTQVLESPIASPKKSLFTPC